MHDFFGLQDFIVIALLGLVLFGGKRLFRGGPPSPPNPLPGDDSCFVTHKPSKSQDACAPR
jgi:hypothetical protein